MTIQEVRHKSSFRHVRFLLLPVLLFIFLFIPFGSSFVTVESSIPDVFLNDTTTYIYGYWISLLDLSPNYHPNGTYVRFRDPDTNSFVTLYGDQSPYYEGGSYTTSLFNVYLSADNTGLGDGLVVISPVAGKSFFDYPFTLGLSDVPFQSQYSDTFLVSSTVTVPYQVSTPAPISLSTNSSSFYSLDLSTIFMPKSFNFASINLSGSSVSSAVDGSASCFNSSGVEFCLEPTLQSTPASPYGSIKLVVRSTSNAVASSGLITLTVNLDGFVFPYKDGVGGYAGLIYSPITSSGSLYEQRINIPYNIFLSNVSSNTSFGGGSPPVTPFPFFSKRIPDITMDKNSISSLLLTDYFRNFVNLSVSIPTFPVLNYSLGDVDVDSAENNILYWELSQINSQGDVLLFFESKNFKNVYNVTVTGCDGFICESRSFILTIKGNFLLDFVNMFGGLFPDVDNLSFLQKWTFVFATMLLGGIIMLLIAGATKLSLWVTLFVEIAMFLFFVASGFISVGVLVILVLIALVFAGAKIFGGS